LAEAQLDFLDDDVILFCFGVLTTQALLLPRFQFSVSKSCRWGVKLTMYGHTIVKSIIYNTQKEAKSDVCRAALRKLQPDFPDWKLPDIIDDVSLASDWNWVDLLQGNFMAEFCTFSGLDFSGYTKFMHGSEFYHRVQVQRTIYTGRIGHYADDEHSRRSCALLALRRLYIDDSDVTSSFLGPSNLKKMDAKMLALVPRDPHQARTFTWECFDHAKAAHSEKRRDRFELPYRRNRRPEYEPSTAYPNEAGENRKRTKVEPRNSNLLLIQRARIASVEVTVKEEEKRWTVTPREIQLQIQSLTSYTGKLQKVCGLLHLEYPEIRVERLDGRLTETLGQYTVGAHFKDDPFLRRAGPIGHVNSLEGTKSMAEQTCAQKVVEFLIQMVEEDDELETTAANERRSVQQWG
ncbi:uncharacterized protein BO97DRAFT_328251, partial [Aspergillus homomorphus CBS 101889]